MDTERIEAHTSIRWTLMAGAVLLLSTFACKDVSGPELSSPIDVAVSITGIITSLGQVTHFVDVQLNNREEAASAGHPVPGTGGWASGSGVYRIKGAEVTQCWDLYLVVSQSPDDGYQEADSDRTPKRFFAPVTCTDKFQWVDVDLLPDSIIVP